MKAVGGGRRPGVGPGWAEVDPPADPTSSRAGGPTPRMSGQAVRVGAAVLAAGADEVDGQAEHQRQDRRDADGQRADLVLDPALLELGLRLALLDPPRPLVL